MAFRDVTKALSWAYMMQEKAIIDAPGYCAGRGTSNDILIGLNAQEAMQQSADIIGIVNNLPDRSCSQYINAMYGKRFGEINDLTERIVARLGGVSVYRRGVQHILAKYCGMEVTKEQIRAGLKCDNNRVSYVRDKVFVILDDVHKLAISYVDSELRSRELIKKG